MAGNTEYKNKYNTENYDRVNLMLEKGLKELAKEKAKEEGLSLNSYLNKLLKDDLKINQKQKRNSSEMDIFLF